tara:strand:+ start:145407 stop:147638 length:2232 start_codon:yes stop_codon:yes gene_type:complete
MRRSRRKAKSLASMFRSSLFWAIFGAMTSFAIADASPIYFIIFVGATLAVWFGSVRPSRPAPRMIINTILLLVIAIAGIEILRSGVGVSAFAVFVALLLVVKMLDLRGPRDDGQVLVLCLSILVAAVLTSNSFLTGAMMLVECVLLLRAFVLFQMYAVVRMGRTPSVRVDKRTRIDIRSMMFGAGFVCVLIAGVLFIILPRNVGSQAFGQWGAGRSVSGFSDEVELGRPGRITMSSTPVLDLTVRDRDGLNVGHENSPPIYLRGAVLERYEHGNWKRSSIMRVPLAERIQFHPPNATIKPRDQLDYSRWDFEYEISLRSVNDGPIYLFTPWRPVEFRLHDQSMRLGYDFSRGLFLRDGVGGSTLEYSVRTVNDAFRTPAIQPDSTRAPVYTADIDQRIIERAYEVVRDGGVEPDPAIRALQMDAAAVRLLETHLRTRYRYTLDALPVPRGRDATEWFLFDRQEGHCEFYASALTLLCRSIGIPARVVTGYIASDFNAVTGQYTVRESNAHAWVEAEIAPNLWRTFDGTPPDDFHNIHVPDPGIMRSIAKMYESIEFLWGRVVIGYDSSAREQLVGDEIGDFGLSSLSDRLLARFAAGRDRLVSRAAIIAVIVFAGSMFIGLALMRMELIIRVVRSWIANLLKRLGFQLELKSRDDEPVHRLERVIHEQLEILGAPRPPWRPLKRHLDEYRDQFAADPHRLGMLREGASLIYRARFGRDGHANAERAAQLVLELRESDNPASLV